MKKLLEIQSELKAPKNQKNSFGNYNYRSCEDILEAVKPILKEKDCILTLCDEMVMLGDRFYVKATAMLTSGTETISTTAFAREEETKKGMDGSQITGAASSYARKYALNALFLIDDTKDSDATNEHDKKENKKKEYKSLTEAKSPTLVEGELETADTHECKKCHEQVKVPASLIKQGNYGPYFHCTACGQISSSNIKKRYESYESKETADAISDMPF